MDMLLESLKGLLDQVTENDKIKPNKLILAGSGLESTVSFSGCFGAGRAEIN